MLEKLSEELDLLQDEIFNCNFSQVERQLLTCIDLLLPYIATLKDKELQKINGVIVCLFEAQQKADYLLIADLIEYRMKPALISKKKENSTSQVSGEAI